MKYLATALFVLLLPISVNAQMTIPQGGTGTTTFPTGWFVTGSSALRLTAKQFINLLTDITGTLPVSNGGTGSTTLSGLLKGNGTGVVQTAIAGIDYQVPFTPVYPILSTANSISLAFGTSTSNTWGGTQTFTNPIVNGTLTGTVNANNGTTYATGTSTPTVGTGLSYSGTLGQFISGVSGTLTNTGVISNSCPGGFLSCSGTNPSTFTLGTLGVANGGTGSTTLTGILLGNGTGTIQSLTVGTGLSLVGTTLSATGGGGSAYPFTPATTYNVLAQATTSPLWLQGSPYSLFASSTSVLSDTGVNVVPAFANLEVQASTSSANPFAVWGSLGSSQPRFNVLANGNVGVGSSTPFFPFTVETATLPPTAYMGVTGGSIQSQSFFNSILAPLSGSNSYSSVNVNTLASSSVSTGSLFAQSINIADAITNTTPQPSMGAASYSAFHRGTGALAFMTGLTMATRNTNTSTVTAFTGISSNMQNSGTFATSTTGIVFSGNYNNNGVGASTADLRVFSSVISNSGSGATVTSAAGYYVGNLTNTTGTIANTYGVFVGDLSAGTQTNFPYSFYASDVNTYNYFAGNTGIGTTSPYAQLSIGGGNLVLGAATAGGTPGDLFLPKLGTAAGTFLAVDATGKVIATTTSSGGVTSVSGTYPIQSTGGATPAISLAFGTTTANTWSAAQTFILSPVFSTLGAGTVNSTAGGTIYNTATTSLSVGSPLTVTGTLGALIGGTNSTINCQTASGAQAGCLASADYTLFNNKISSTSLSATAPLTYNSGTGVFAMPPAATAQNGYLTSTDWNTFNGKESALTFTYPISRSANTVSLAFGTTTTNTWSNTQTFTSGAIFGQTASPSYTRGGLYYDTGNESLTFYNNDSQISLQIGQEEWTKVINNTGSTIANGAAVYQNGTSGGLATVAPAQANAGATTVVLGLMTESCTNGSTCYVTTIGNVNGIDTSALSAGVVYLSATTPGGLTNTAPVSPNYRMRVGFVTSVNALTGRIHVTPSTAALGNGTAGQFNVINGSGSQVYISPSYPLVSNGTTFSLAFGTTTSNTWAGLQTFTNASSTAWSSSYASSTLGFFGSLTLPNLGTPAGSFLAVNAAGQVIATSTPTGSNFFTNSGIYTYLSTGTNLGIGSTTPYSPFSMDVASSTDNSSFPFMIRASIASTIFRFFGIDQWGHQYTGGNAPTSSAGVVTGDDNTGFITTAGTGPVLTFAHPWRNTPSCVCSPAVAGDRCQVTAASATSVTFAQANNNTLYYQCRAHF